MNIDENYPYLYKANYKKLDKNVLLETNVEEERRLLYVAMTRAEERLYIYERHKDSKFIKELKEIESILTECKE